MENSVTFNLPNSIVLSVTEDNTDNGRRKWVWEVEGKEVIIEEYPLGIISNIIYPEHLNPDDDAKKTLNDLFKDFITEFESQIENGVEPDAKGSIEAINKFPYDPKQIRISRDVWSIASVDQYLVRGIINLSPDFQRNFVWDKTRQSQLIESILLGIPVPAFYLAKSGKSHQVVDGLQRLTTIKRFINNEFPLKNLEYLNEKQQAPENNLEGCFYNKGKKTIGADYEFALTGAQLHFNIIDENTPTQVKFDIFRRLNTGGKPLNAQEIRNCMMEEDTRNLINNLVDIFLKATNYSVGTTRMNAHELIMRFIAFWYERINKKQDFIYQGNMQNFLDNTVDILNMDQGKYHSIITDSFSLSMKNSIQLFSSYAFRKCLPEHLRPGARTQLVNKSLFTTWSVLLSQIDPDTILDKTTSKGGFIEILADDLDKSRKKEFVKGGTISYFDAVSYGTNDRIALQSAFDNAERLIKTNILQ